MKKVISSLTAVLLVFSAAAAVSADSRMYFSPEQMTEMIDYMTGNEKIQETTDVNGDGTVNILDVISMKEGICSDYSYYQHILSCADYDRDVCSNEKLSKMASVVADVLNDIIKTEEMYTETANQISSDEESEISEKINTVLTEKYGYRNLKWMALYRYKSTESVLCTVNDKNTGSYPEVVPDDIYVPFDSAFLFSSYSTDFKWESFYSTTTQLNNDARYIVQRSRVLIQNALKKGSISEDELSGDFIIDSRTTEGPLCQSLKKAFSSVILRYNTDWIIAGHDGIPYFALITNLSGNTGAFPASVPQRLDVPYSSDLIEYASGVKKWNDAFSDFVSEKSERKLLPDYPDITDEDALSRAALLYDHVLWYIEEYNAAIGDGVYSSDDAFETIPELMNDFRVRDAMTTFCNERYSFTVKDGTIVSAEYVNESSGKRGFIDSELFRELIENESQENNSHHFTGSSQTVATGGSHTEYVPEPDYRLYYSTDTENYNLSVVKYKGSNAAGREPVTFRENVESTLGSPETEWNVIVTGIASTGDRYIGGYPGK